MIFSKIKSTGYYVPEKIITNNILSQYKIPPSSALSKNTPPEPSPNNTQVPLSLKSKCFDQSVY